MSLRAVFSPKSIMVIGASHEVGSVGNDVVKNLSEKFQGKIFLVNPKGGELYGLPVYTDVSTVPQQAELAIVAVPARIVAPVLKAAGKKKIKAAVVLSAGFSEVGEEALEKQLVAIANQYKFTLVGPNCLGVINAHHQMNASFAPTMPKPGSIAFLSQSGALGVAILDFAAAQNIGISKFLSLGNQAATKEAQLLNYLAADEETKVILMYIEQLSDLAPVLEAAQKIRRTKHPKPIIALKSGQTKQGAAAAQSHTGSLAGNDELYDSLFRQAGILRAETIEDLFLYAECFVYNKLLKKDRVAVITNAGGLGVLTTDALVTEKLTLAQFSSATEKKIKKILPAAASTHNPVDILGDAPAARYEAVIEPILSDKHVDAVLVLLTPQSMTEVEKTAEVIVAAKRKSNKPIIVSFLGGERVTDGIDILEEGKTPETGFPELAAQGLAALHKFTQWKTRTEKPMVFKNFDHHRLHDLLGSENPRKSRWLGGDDALEVLEACKLPVPAWTVIKSEKDFTRAAEACGSQMVLKVLADSSVHKSDMGGVLLGVTPENIEKKYQELQKKIKAARLDQDKTAVLAMEQVSRKSQEVIVGAVRDPNFGALVGCGMGGIFTEIFKDAAFGLAPLTPDDCDDILERLKVTTVLKGARGGSVFDTVALKETLARISQLMMQYPQIAELDINPLLVLTRGSGVIAVDGRIKVGFES